MILIIIAIAVINYNIRDGVRFRARVQVKAMKDNNFWTMRKPTEPFNTPMVPSTQMEDQRCKAESWLVKG